MNPDYQYMVCSWCITFNHAPYIIDTLYGFCRQETNFPVINVVIDDCSTDGEEDVIDAFVAKELDISDNTTARHEENDEFIMTFARHKTNQNCYFVIYYYKENHYSIKKPRPSIIDEWKENAKYVALCEGDDYWIDSTKLQKQVDYMETHPDCSLVFHNAFIEDAETKKRRGVHKIYNNSRYTPLAHIIRDGGFIPTASILYRQSMFAKYAEFPKNCPASDMIMQTYAALVGKVYYIHETMSVYRLVKSSATHVLMAKAGHWVEHQNQIINWYKTVDEYTNHKYEKEVKGAIVFSEARIIIDKREYFKLWAPKYWSYVWNKPLIVRLGLFISMMGLGCVGRWGQQMLYKHRNK